MSVTFEVERVDHLSPTEFTERYVRRRRPVLISGGLNGCSAMSQWNLDYLRQCAGDRNVVVKNWGAAGIEVSKVRLRSYVDSLERYEYRRADGGPMDLHRPAYLHDIPLTSVLPQAANDLAQFPADFFPEWYGANWTCFAQLFLGPSESVTPLHFDCLLTHNLFFQLIGRKKFTLIPHEQLAYCYPHSWRWCRVDADSPDFEKYPLYRKANPVEVIVEPGDVLYMPPGMLHHVRSVDCALSFNVDWHTKDSAVRGVLAIMRGMPAKNLYYNSILMLGLWTGLSSRRLLPFYQSYLNYVS